MSLEWEAVLRNGFILGGNPRMAQIGKRKLRALVFRGRIPFYIAIPVGADPVVFTRHRIQLGTKVAGPESVRLFLGWKWHDEKHLWEFADGKKPRRHAPIQEQGPDGSQVDSDDA